MGSRNEAGEARHGKIDGRICIAAPVEKRLPRQVDLPFGRPRTLGTLQVHVRGVGNTSKCARTMHAKVRAGGGGGVGGYTVWGPRLRPQLRRTTPGW